MVSKLAARLIAAVGVVTLVSCGGTDMRLNDRPINGVDESIEVAEHALDAFAGQTGAGVESARCHLRVRGNEETGGQVPVGVDCLPVAFLGSAGFNAVSFGVSLIDDPSAPKDLLIDVEVAEPKAVTFQALDDEFRPDLPETLEAVGSASVPAGTIQLNDRLVRQADLEAFVERALDLIASDDRHTVEEKFTMADVPVCLFAADLEGAWCGPGVSLTNPAGEVAFVKGRVPSISLADYRLPAPEDAERSDAFGPVWAPVGEQPANLFDVSGEPASLPGVETISRPELPKIEAGFFADVTNAEASFGCLPTGRAASLCDERARTRLEVEPSSLKFVSGTLELSAVAFGDQTGNADLSDITVAEHAADGEQLIAISATLSRDNEVPDTEQLEAEIVVDGRVVGGWEGYTGERSFFLSAPSDAVVAVRLRSSGESQDLVLENSSVRRETARPEIYEEHRAYVFSDDQTIPIGNEAMPVAVDGTDAWQDGALQAYFAIVDDHIALPSPGNLFLMADVDVRFFHGDRIPPTVCDVELVLADSTRVKPTPVGNQKCPGVYGGFQAYFEIPVDADIVELAIDQLRFEDSGEVSTYGSVSVPVISR